MTFDHYLPPNLLHIIFAGLLWGGGACIVFGGVTAAVCLAFKSEGAKSAVKGALLIGAAFGLIGGAIGGGSTVNDDNMNILQSNVSKKYNTQITEMGHDDYARGAPYSPKETKTHEVTILVDGKSELAYLKQDPETFEPTLLDYDTKQPLKSLEKNSEK